MIDGYPEQPPTPRQFQVGEMFAMGRTASQIAETLTISSRTVESHIQGFYAATGCENRSDAFDWFRRNIWTINSINALTARVDSIKCDFVSGEDFTLTARQNEFNGINIIIA